MLSIGGGLLRWNCIGCGKSGQLRVKVRVVGSYTPNEWNYFHELSANEHKSIERETGKQCNQPVTWTVVAETSEPTV